MHFRSRRRTPAATPTAIPTRRLCYQCGGRQNQDSHREEAKEATQAGAPPHPNTGRECQTGSRRAREQNTTRYIKSGEKHWSRMGQADIQYAKVRREHSQATFITKTEEESQIMQKARRGMPHLRLRPPRQRGRHRPTSQGMQGPPRLHENRRLLPPPRRQRLGSQRPKSRTGLQKIPQRRQIPLLPPRLRKEPGHPQRRRTARKIRRHGTPLDTTLAQISIGFVFLDHFGGATSARGGVRRV
mmetsp:Transcript_8826/g.19042  ORF Transcript_8826/g.19042 Transcript_8826/m.19042 type:complete len:243 (+) Transcript_8826:391-1119(+)